MKNRIAGLWVPQPSPDRKAIAHRMALDALAPKPSPVAFKTSGRLVFRFAAACLVAAAIATFLMLPGRKAAHDGGSTAVNNEPTLKTLKEIGLLFPDQLDAIIARKGQLDLQLADSRIRGNPDQAVKITCSKDKESCVIITYSGRNVKFDFAGGELRITPLIDGSGSVILLAPDRVILAQDTSNGPFHLSAVTLANR